MPFPLTFLEVLIRDQLACCFGFLVSYYIVKGVCGRTTAHVMAARKGTVGIKRCDSNIPFRTYPPPPSDVTTSSEMLPLKVSTFPTVSLAVFQALDDRAIREHFSEP